MKTMSEHNRDAVCKMCSNTYGWHKDNNPRHPFVPLESNETMPLTKKDRQKQQKTVLQTREWPADPILRIALIDKGLLSMADIIAAEQKLREAADNGGVIRLHGSQQQGDSEDNVELGAGDSP